MKWIDFVLRLDEEGVSQAIDSLSGEDRMNAINEFLDVLGLSPLEFERSALRILVERARPLALPAELWSRPLTASNDQAALVKAHFKHLGVAETPDRLRRALSLYAQFAEERGATPVTEALLKSCKFRCQHCGLAFCDENLVKKAIESPFGQRSKQKVDPLKPHWNHGPDMREPTHDHVWPISLYGGNRPTNLNVICKGCNLGKEMWLALEQYPSSVGLPRRTSLTNNIVSWEAFYVQLRRAPDCVLTGKTAADVELTVRLKDINSAPVLDNLETVESSGL